MKVKLIQTRYNATCTKVIEKTVIGRFKTRDAALQFLANRGYLYDSVVGGYIVGNAKQFPVTVEEKEYDIFDIRAFV